MVYRDDAGALLAQCDALRRELARTEVDAATLERLHRELDRKTRELRSLRALVDPHQIIARRRMTAMLAVVGSCVLGTVMLSGREHPYHAPPPASAASWFASARAHCNPLEVHDWLTRSRPPEDGSTPGYLATCWALGGDIDEARIVLAAAGRRRPTAVKILFDTAHPIADRGDDRAAGPIMGLVLEVWPENYMAWYHAGMSDYAGGDAVRAKQRLTRFLELYAAKDGWHANAERALAGIASGTPFRGAFSGAPDPRIE